MICAELLRVALSRLDTDNKYFGNISVDNIFVELHAASTGLITDDLVGRIYLEPIVQEMKRRDATHQQDRYLEDLHAILFNDILSPQPSDNFVML